MSTFTPSQKRQHLRKLLEEPKAVVAPGIYDGYGARMVQNAGFHAAYMTGNGVSATLLGIPDIGQIDLKERKDSGLIYLNKAVPGVVQGVASIHLSQNHRHPIVEQVINVYKQIRN